MEWVERTVDNERDDDDYEARHLSSREPAKAQNFGERDYQVDYPQAAYRAANIHVVPVVAQLREDAGEVVTVPVFGPREDQQEEPDLQAEGNEYHRRHLVVPVIHRGRYRHRTVERLGCRRRL